nr:zinc finger, CCHC-type [Tanacetum cinerariifolium]
MQIILEANSLWETIDPNGKTKADNRKDKTAIAFLYQALPEDQLLQITKHKTAKAIWDTLKTRHIGEERVQQARLQTLKSDFKRLHMKKDETIDIFTTKLTTLVNKAASLGHTMEDETLVRKLLNTVPDRYLQIVASIEQYSDLSEMTLEEAISRLNTYEERIKGRGRGKHKFSQGRNHENFKEERKDEETSHRSYNKNNFKKSNYDTRKLQCYKCKKLGHIAPDCHLRIKTNEQSNLVEEDLEPTLLMAILEDEEQEVSLHEKDVGYKETNMDSLWYLDNGASNHMTGVREHFKELDEEVSGNVRFGDGSYIEIKGKGLIIIECDDEKQRIISHIYYIPDLKSNLLSLGQFTEIGCKVVMEDDELRLYDIDNKIFMKVTQQRNRLYKANLRIEAVRHAIYILNSVPTKALEEITPYEAIKRRKPNLENLRVFGCIAYAKVPSQHLKNDSSYGVNTQEGKGTTGIIFYYGESPISWSTKKQATIALSSCESEFIAATTASIQALWLKRLLSKLTDSQEEKVTIQVDNKSAISLMKNLVFHGRSKHIATNYHFIRECVERKDIQVEFVNGEYQKADILTKALPKIKFLTMRQLIDLKVLSHSSVPVIQSALEEFNSIFGLKPSMEKSLVFFGNVPDPIKAYIFEIMPFSIGSFPIKYLGVPFISSRLCPLCQFISKRDIFEASLSLSCNNADVVKDGELMLEKVLWKSRNNKVRPFSVNFAWSDLLVPKPIVPWFWNKVDLLKRPLCNSVKDDHDHLFFGCDFSIRDWEHLKDLMRFEAPPDNIFLLLSFFLLVLLHQTMSGEGKVVCVTGASGFIASWLVKLLLARGYSVHATVRSLGDQKKTKHLFALDGAKERLSLYEANLIEDGSFDSAVKGCVCVFHTTSPVQLTVDDPQAQLIDHAVQGTLRVCLVREKYSIF